VIRRQIAKEFHI